MGRSTPAFQGLVCLLWGFREQCRPGALEGRLPSALTQALLSPLPAPGPWLESHGPVAAGLMAPLIKRVSWAGWPVFGGRRPLPPARVHSCDSRQKEQMQKRNGGKTVDERQLFHGTSAGFVDAICQQNFDWRVSGLHGASYGRGKCEAASAGRTLLASLSRARKPLESKLMEGVGGTSMSWTSGSDSVSTGRDVGRPAGSTLLPLPCVQPWARPRVGAGVALLRLWFGFTGKWGCIPVGPFPALSQVPTCAVSTE